MEKEEEEQDRILEHDHRGAGSLGALLQLPEAGGHQHGGRADYKTEEDMMKVRNLGKKSLQEVKEKLAALIFHFVPRTTDRVEKVGVTK